MSTRYTIWYDGKEDADLESNLMELSKLRDTKYWRRKSSIIAGMILPVAVRNELKKYKSSNEQKKE